MAASYTIYRNYDSTDTESTSMTGGLPQITDIDESSIDPVDWSRDNYDFLGWNDSRDGSGNMYQPGDTPAAYSLFAIWEEAAVIPDVTISYNGDTIASLSDSGMEVLETSGKFCVDDITIEYTKPSPNLQSKSVSPTTSSQTITADSGYDGLSQVTVSEIKLHSKSVSPTTSSQTITADSGYDGLSQVTVNAISPTKTAQTYTPTTTDQTIASGRWLTGNQTIKGDANLVASNIKKDVQIFGVTGSYEGSGGGGSDPVAEKDVNFIDYDGTLLYSYTASEFANLSALPANPSHKGLVAQGWNWTLANAKTYVASYGKLWIGQMYITESGDTEIDIELHAPRLSPYLGIAIKGTVEVDWGDGSTKSTVIGASLTNQISTAHVYATDGSYTIKIHVVSGSFSLYGTSTYSIFSGNFSVSNYNRVYASSVKRVRIGSSMPSIGTYAFYACYSLASITIPNSVTSIGTNAFYTCYSLTSLTVPNNITTISSYAFAACYSLASITIPNSVTSIGSNAFNSSHGLGLIIIPSSVTSIGAYAFYACYSLASITILSNVTSIGNSTFGNCQALASITIPSSITSIGTSVFSNCYGLGLIRFESTTPPTVSGISAWTSIPTDCVIHVPSGSLSAYTSATNYPSSSTYTYVED